MISNWFDLYFPLFQFYDDDYKTKEIQVKQVSNHFDLKFILTLFRLGFFLVFYDLEQIPPPPLPHNSENIRAMTTRLGG